MPTSFWRLGPGIVFSAKTSSPIESALNTVFGLFKVENPIESPRSLSAESTSFGWVLKLDEIPFGHCEEESGLAPLLESCLTDYCVKARRDCLVLHAACIDFNGSTWLFPGERRSGKSTLSYLLSSSGTYAGDDLCFFQEEGFSIEPFPKAVTLKEGSFSLNAEAPEFQDPLRGKVKLCIPKASTREDLPFDQVKGILFPQFEAGSLPEREHVDPAIAAMALIQQLCGGLDRHSRNMDLIEKLAQLPATLIRYSSFEDAVRLVEEVRS